MLTSEHALFTPAVLAKDALLYLRQSTPGQVRDNVGSTALQREQRRIARALGFPEERIHEIDADLGRSGSSTIQRTGLADIKRRIVSGTVGAIFAISVSRVARLTKDFEDVRTLARDHGVVLVINGRPVDPSEARDVAFVQVQAILAELENKARIEGMLHARLAKARSGAVVSQLPIGWIQLPDETWDFDPEVRPAIENVYVVFRRVGTLRGTVAELNRAQRPLPTRYRGRLEWKPATVDAVRRILTNRAYAGWYEFGKTRSRMDVGLQPNGHAVRAPVPEHLWIRRRNHHPAYLSDAEQGAIRARLAQNEFRWRSRPGAGYALLQGIVRCGVCNGTLAPVYPRPNHGAHRYQCNVMSSKCGVSPCLSVQGRDLDAALERAVLAVLGTPPLETLTHALTQARAAEAAERDRIELDRERLEAAERMARERYEACDPRKRRVRIYAEERLEQAMQEREAFEAKLASEPPAPSVDATEEELRELCALASDVPKLWSDPGVTSRERKELLRTLVQYVIVQVQPDRVEAMVHWQSGVRERLFVWRHAGMHALVLRLHGEGLTLAEIQDRLAAGDPDTGQSWHISRSAISQQLKRSGLRPHRLTAATTEAVARVRQLYDRGMTLAAIADAMNRAGAVTAQGLRWSENAVYRALEKPGRRDQLERLHRIALRRLKRRGLSNAQAAEELNRAGVPRVGNRRWTGEHVRQRKTQLGRLGRLRRARAEQSAEPNERRRRRGS